MSLLDLCKACDITIRYTSMRKQFRTKPNTKDERRIIEYQAVVSRIADGLALAFSLASLLGNVKPGFTNYFQFGHHLALEQVMSLRECCGGFGYLKASGHPLLIERLALRSSEADGTVVTPIPKDTLKEYSPYVTDSDYNVKFEYSNNKPKTESNYFLLAAQHRFLEDKTPEQWRRYAREFVKSCAIQQFLKSEVWNSFRKGMTNVSDLARYISTSETLANSKYIKWGIMKESTREEVLDTVTAQRRSLLNSIKGEIQMLRDCLPVSTIKDLVLGRHDENQFYEDVLTTSKTGYRNSVEFKDFAKRPIVEYLNNLTPGSL